MVSKLVTVAAVGFFSLSGPQSQSDEIAVLKREIEQLKTQQTATQRDVELIKNLLQSMVRGGRPEPALNSSISLAGEPVKGSPAAKVTLVEVSDYHCPFCRRHMQQTQPQIDANYIATGKVRYVFVDYPIEQLHPDAFRAHEAANCAGEQGKYWEMHAQLFATPTRDAKQLISQAGEIGLNTEGFRSCLEGGKFAAPVRESVARMQKIGIDSTPMFLLGLTPPDGQPMKVLKVVKGAVPYSEFKNAIEAIAQ
jgi:protein-disulfide isomerase